MKGSKGRINKCKSWSKVTTLKYFIRFAQQWRSMNTIYQNLGSNPSWCTFFLLLSFVFTFSSLLLLSLDPSSALPHLIHPPAQPYHQLPIYHPASSFPAVPSHFSPCPPFLVPVLHFLLPLSQPFKLSHNAAVPICYTVTNYAATQGSRGASGRHNSWAEVAPLIYHILQLITNNSLGNL